MALPPPLFNNAAPLQAWMCDVDSFQGLLDEEHEETRIRMGGRNTTLPTHHFGARVYYLDCNWGIVLTGSAQAIRGMWNDQYATRYGVCDLLARENAVEPLVTTHGTLLDAVDNHGRMFHHFAGAKMPLDDFTDFFSTRYQEPHLERIRIDFGTHPLTMEKHLPNMFLTMPQFPTNSNLLPATPPQIHNRANYYQLMRWRNPDHPHC
eukprot:g20902.t1